MMSNISISNVLQLVQDLPSLENEPHNIKGIPPNFKEKPTV